jgi:hypothetical protein
MEEHKTELASLDVYLVQQMDFKLPSATRSRKPTWKTNPFNLSFTSNLSSEKLAARYKQYPEWLSYFMKMECIYHNSACMKLTSDEVDLSFANEFAATIEPLEVAAGRRAQGRDIPDAAPSITQVKKGMSAEIQAEVIESGTGLDISNIEAWLFYEISLRQWQVIYKFTITTTSAHLNDMVISSPGLRSHRNDLYNIIRDMFAVSDGTDKVLASVQKIQRSAMARGLELCRLLYGVKKKYQAQELLTFPESCTNVSFFISTSDAKQLKNNLVRETNRAERKRDNVLDFFGKKRRESDVYRDVELFQFGGRFNTILVDCEPIGALGGPSDVAHGYQMQFMPTLFHSMLMWGYLGHMTEAMQLIERGILTDSSAKTNSRIRYFNSLINSIEYASFENETFKRGIEQDNEIIYSKIEEKWNIHRSLIQMKDFASYLSHFLDRDYQEHVLKADRKQNVVLFLIALLGLFGLISVWDDYLDLVTSQYFHEALNSEFIDTVFPNIEALTMFSVWMPVIALIICVIAIICLIRWRPK